MNSENEKNRFRQDFIPENIRQVFLKALKQALKVSWILLKIYIPVSLLTAFLDRLGFLDFIAPYFEPLMKLLGLPGEAALVFLAAWVNNLFAAIAAASVLDLSVRQITLIAIVTGFAHNLIVETGILVKLKMGRPAIALTRIVFSFLAGILLHRIMPQTLRGTSLTNYETAAAFSWPELFLKILITAAEILLMMFLIMLLYELVLLWKQRGKIKNAFSGITRYFGMSPSAMGPWLVGTFIGIAYGAGILFSMNKKQVLTHKDNCMLTLSMCLLHAVVEDTVIFAAIGANVFWILGFRILIMFLILSIIARGELYRKLTWIGLPKEPAIQD
ncbi:MAG: hypothetical protein PHQ41_10650 [Candidatus Cloacimonetes bacterium]|nr:hypothetical protein [Candidatus Cloacimonadota bacterium]MDD3716976.1 hypothetical protein [Candidatus Neomarinimicrobiota bacterium]MDD5709768.1 hypothetical protein [Candidatus Neomarinimicrobiota bacterium]